MGASDLDIRVAFRTPLIAICLLSVLSGCSEGSSEPRSSTVTSPSIVGSWLLLTVDGREPETENIESYRCSFFEDGTWNYEMMMIGPYAGIMVKNSGTWTLSGGQLSYTLGDNSGITQITLAHGWFVLNPDPIIQSTGLKNVPTKFARQYSR